MLNSKEEFGFTEIERNPYADKQGVYELMSNANLLSLSEEDIVSQAGVTYKQFDLIRVTLNNLSNELRNREVVDYSIHTLNILTWLEINREKINAITGAGEGLNIREKRKLISRARQEALEVAPHYEAVRILTNQLVNRLLR